MTEPPNPATCPPHAYQRTKASLALLLFTAVCAACSSSHIRPVSPDVVVDRSPERVERGKYLVDSVMACGTCHTTRADGESSFLEAPDANRYLGGGVHVTEPAFDAYWYVPNITSDNATGVGGWSDDELLRSIRDGVTPDERLLFPMMPYGEYQYLSDQDAEAVVAYLRTVEKVSNPTSRPEMPQIPLYLEVMMDAMDVGKHPPAVGVPHPDEDNALEYGEYLARAANCIGCHSTDDKPESHLGGYSSDDPAMAPNGLGKVFPKNLTPDPEFGLGKYSAAQIKGVLVAGLLLNGKRMAPPMSMVSTHLATWKSKDIDALVAYLQSVPAIHKKDGERQLSPTWAATLGDDAQIAAK